MTIDERTQSAPAPTAHPSGDHAETVSVTIYLPVTLRERARAAYKATSFREDDRSFSHMLEKMIADEITRRERVYNEGKGFPGGNKPLAPGRPYV